jgi:hypothetical protein
MANFNISLSDLINGKSFGAKINAGQKNYTPSGEAKPLVTSESKQLEPKKGLTTANISDILQNQLTIKDKGMVSTQFNEVLSKDMSRLLGMSIEGVNTKMSRSLAGITGYDIPRSVGSYQLLNTGTPSPGNYAPTSPASTGAPNTNVPTPIPESGTMIDYAKSRLGCAYVWAAEGPDTFDCSGLVTWAYKKVGTTLSHYSGAQYNETTRVTKEQLQPGDLIFWGPNASEHVAIYLGEDKMIHAFDGVQITNFQGWWKEPFGYGRVTR